MSIEVMRQALEALDWCDNALMEGTAIHIANRSAAAALRQAIEQAGASEPVAEARFDGTLRWLEPYGIGLHRVDGPLYLLPTAPAQPLTDRQIDLAIEAWFCLTTEYNSSHKTRMRNAIEAARGIKGETK